MRTVEQWLAFQERLHPKAIDPGLDRVRATACSLGLLPAPCPVITVAGTNGKGSCVAFLSALLRAAGHRTGVYTSPHLIRYHERIVVDGIEIDDIALCAAFEQVDCARDGSSLTYFEFGTLAAMQHFRETRCDVVVLEVGMGGRLDATNVWDADAAVVVSIGLDHTEWLGPDRESIGFEKAGVFRPGRPAVSADPHPPQSIAAHAAHIGAHLVAVGEHYRFAIRPDGSWDFQGLASRYEGLPPPALPGLHQYGNAAAALAMLDGCPALFPPDRAVVATGLSRATLQARFQTVRSHPTVLVDVTHNTDGARVLARSLAQLPAAGRTLAVCGMMADKPVAMTLAALDAEVDYWIFVSLPAPRGASAELLAERAAEAGLHAGHEACADVAAGLVRAQELAGTEDRVLVFGSFLTAAAALQKLPPLRDKEVGGPL